MRAEALSRFYKFIIELKKSPKAVHAYQARAQFLSLEAGFNFPKGGRLFRILGHGFTRGRGISVYEVPDPTKRSR